MTYGTGILRGIPEEVQFGLVQRRQSTHKIKYIKLIIWQQFRISHGTYRNLRFSASIIDFAIMERSIDAVFTWVNGADPHWQAKKKRVLRDEPYYEGAIDGDVAKRFIECNELYYSINLLRSNASWIRTIYVITDNQCPEWLTERERNRLDVIIVDHVDIFVDHNDVLPTFNSQSIETMVANIPGLSEKFIYFNDDVFIIRPVVPSDFFNGDQLVVRGRWGLKNIFLEKVLRRLTHRWSRRGYVCRRPGTALLPGMLRYIDLAHTPHGLFKSDVHHVFDENRTRENTRYRVRGADQLWPIGFVANQARRIRGVIRKNDDWVCLEYDELYLIRSLERFVKDREWLRFLCLNSLSELDLDKLSEVQDALDRLLEEPIDVSSEVVGT